MQYMKKITEHDSLQVLKIHAFLFFIQHRIQISLLFPRLSKSIDKPGN